MLEKILSNVTSDGYFICPCIADESPLEPGTYLIPAGAIDAPIPTIPEGQRAKWNGVWVFEDIPQPEPEPEEAPPTQAELDSMRIVELKQLLNDSDFKVLPDYDQPSEDIKIQRQAWREEIRILESNIENSTEQLEEDAEALL